MKDLDSNFAPQFMDCNLYHDPLISLVHWGKFTDNIKWKETDCLTSGPIIGYGPIRDPSYFPIQLAKLSHMHFIDGSLITRESTYDMILAFNAALLLLYEQMPATKGNISFNVTETFSYLEKHVDGIENFFTTDGGLIMGGVSRFERKYQMIIALPVELIYE